MVTLTVFGAIRRTLGRSLRNGFLGLIVGGGLVEGLSVFLNRSDVSLQNLNLNATPTFTLFVHVAAVLLGLTMGALFAVWTAAFRTVKGVIQGADNAVDAIDGPNRGGLF